jgi:hypothetical protein
VKTALTITGYLVAACAAEVRLDIRLRPLPRAAALRRLGQAARHREGAGDPEAEVRANAARAGGHDAGAGAAGPEVRADH